MIIWELYKKEDRERYIQYLKIYGSLTNMFRQKQGDMIPYLDSKFQETVFSKVFKSENVDVGNTPHDVLSVFGGKRIGIGLKTWMGSKPSFQKVMQLKRYNDEIHEASATDMSLAYKISEIKNERMRSDYERLGLSENSNVYHYVTRDKGSFTINECPYPLIDLNGLKDFKRSKTAFQWSDGISEYKYTFADSQVYKKFDPNSKDNIILEKFEIDIIENPFDF